MRPLVFLLLLVRAAPAQESDAEKLFKKMEERLAAAKTLQYTVKATSDRSPLDTTEARVLLGEGSRLRIDYSMHKGDPVDRYLIVSDGKKLKQTRQEQSWGPWDASADMNAVVKTGLARAGGAFFLMYYRMESREEALKALPISEFKSDGKEKVGTTDCDIVTYELVIPDRGKMAVKLWIDPKTTLPLRRTITAEFQGTKVTSTSTYEGFKLDEAIDDAKFKLP